MHPDDRLAAPVSSEHAVADLEGIPASRLGDAQGLGPLLLAAANAAGLHPIAPPLVHARPGGVTAVLPCHGGHVAIHTLPDAGVCFADVLAVEAGRPQQGLEVILRRLAARTVHADVRRRGPGVYPSSMEVS
jgi:S-adenosylmethionine/arginine decarboxylase-like enzyme